MKKIFLLGLITSSVLFSATNEQVVKFIKGGLSQNPMVTVDKIDVVDKGEVKFLKGWEYFIVDFKVTINQGKKKQDIEQKEILFASGNFVTPDLININTHKSIKNLISPTIPDNYYDKAHLIAGNINAKHKIVVFSDPVCPFCKRVMPEIIDDVNKNSDKLALFYYHMPLEMIHPSALTITKAILALSKKDKDIVKKVYQTDLDYAKSKPEEILKEFNSKLGTNLKLTDINTKEILAHIENDKKASRDMLVKGTPTVFFDGKIDNTREKYKDVIKGK